jgi:hypothetical protein
MKTSENYAPAVATGCDVMNAWLYQQAVMHLACYHYADYLRLMGVIPGKFEVTPCNHLGCTVALHFPARS